MANIMHRVHGRNTKDMNMGIKDTQQKVLHISVISDVTLEPFFSIYIQSYFGDSAKVYFIPSGERNTEEYRQYTGISDILIVWLTLDASYPYVCDILNLQAKSDRERMEEVILSCKSLYFDLLECRKAQIFWLLFEDYFSALSNIEGYQYRETVSRLNLELSTILQNNVILINLERMIAEVGIAKAYDFKGKYRWNAPYSKELVETAVKEIRKQYLIEQGITKKCLVLDCDNVLWGGIIAEDGIENLKLGGSGLGRMYQDFQKFVRSLYFRGVILAVCSKNDLEDVLRMFREHSGMILLEKYISCFQVNWENKPDNIEKIAEYLNIGLDSIVFVDDSPAEIEAVRSFLPDVVSVLFKKDMDYGQFSCFNLRSNANVMENLKRNETYQTNYLRNELREKYASQKEYIAALGLCIDIHEALPTEYNRISELTQRTNKCTNGKRYTVTEIRDHLSSGKYTLYSVCVSDSFSDLGLVGAMEVCDSMLTLFSLSCRALGREIENKMLDCLFEHHQIESYDYYTTGKNRAVNTFLEDVFGCC